MLAFSQLDPKMMAALANHNPATYTILILNLSSLSMLISSSFVTSVSEGNNSIIIVGILNFYGVLDAS